MPPLRRPRHRVFEATIRLTPGELVQLDQLAVGLGLSRSAAVRRLVFERALPVPTSPELLLELVQLGRRLNELARWSNQARALPPSETLLPLLEQLERTLGALSPSKAKP